jgi:restriction system protein
MAIPDYQSLMLPLLRYTEDGQAHSLREVTEALAAELGLSEAEVTEMLPSGAQAVFRNRVGWAKAYMKQAGLLEIPKRGSFRITQDGLELLATNPPKVDNSILGKYKSFVDFKNRKKPKSSTLEQVPQIESMETPEDAMAGAYTKLRMELENELLFSVKAISPSFFEQIVIDLLVKMGYGGNRQDAAKAVGQSGDEGIDGIINEDLLGLDVVYIQAKRWENTVSRPELQKFTGALAGKQARKGIFITTSTFTSGAVEYVAKIDPRIVLIDGERLTKLMVDHNVGVSTVGNYEIKKVDSDYFDE